MSQFIEDAHHHASEALSLSSSLPDHETAQAQVHALLAIHYDLRFLIEFLEYRYG